MAKVASGGSIQVIARRQGFDGVQIRQPGEIFFVSARTFNDIDAQNAKRVKHYEAAVKAAQPGVDLVEPQPEDTWFERYTPGKKEGSDLV